MVTWQKSAYDLHSSHWHFQKRWTSEIRWAQLKRWWYVYISYKFCGIL